MPSYQWKTSIEEEEEFFYVFFDCFRVVLVGNLVGGGGGDLTMCLYTSSYGAQSTLPNNGRRMKTCLVTWSVYCILSSQCYTNEGEERLTSRFLLAILLAVVVVI